MTTISVKESTAQGRTTPPAPRKRVRVSGRTASRAAVLIVATFLTLGPVVWTVLTSMRPPPNPWDPAAPSSPAAWTCVPTPMCSNR